MSLSEEVVFPVRADELELLIGQAHGFVAAKLVQPFRTVSVRIVSQKEIGDALLEMVTEVKEMSFAERKTPAMVKSLIDTGEGFLTKSFVQMISSKILGLYKQSYIEDGPGELLLVGENIENVATALDLPLREFFLWVLVHETMHVAQFNSKDSYLRDFIKEKVIEITKGKNGQKEALKEVGLAMTWIEGSADAMMDQEGLIDKKIIEKMRQKIEAKRDRISWSSLLLQILTKKTKQYREGRRFTEIVAKEYGMQPMSLIINDPTWLPMEEEIRSPSLWVQRFEKSNNQGT
jgi:uncharacterized protein (DUF2342 family)